MSPQPVCDGHFMGIEYHVYEMCGHYEAHVVDQFAPDYYCEGQWGPQVDINDRFSTSYACSKRTLEGLMIQLYSFIYSLVVHNREILGQDWRLHTCRNVFHNKYSRSESGPGLDKKQSRWTRNFGFECRACIQPMLDESMNLLNIHFLSPWTLRYLGFTKDD